MGTSPITIGVGNSAKALGKSITTAQRVTPPAKEQPPRARKAEFVVCDQTIERLWSRLKEWRCIATRYEKTAASFLGVLSLAATFDWIKRKRTLALQLHLSGPI
jgi:transposase